ncbi:L-seryl-tRNA(Sec) selenium transferase [Methylobacterium oryzae]|uniref:L-seryl-tRNA(Sec) selenium transferase n=1 Tax=Methylobacterium oryzae TaxID=334852 RepID=UPI002F34F00A
MNAPVPTPQADDPAPSPRRIPAVERLVGGASAAELETYGRTAFTDAIRAVLAEIRAGGGPVPDTESIRAAASARLAAERRPSLRPVFNLTGTVLHTNLGRALLPRSAAEAVAAVMVQASNLEFDLETGARGERDDHVEALICRLTGAEAAVVVNNNAAAVLLVLNALAMRKEVVVSRGELVEIGGSFRVPDVMVRAGCRLREVGTTNRTHLRDYAEALGPRTGLVMKVHPSNYAIAGFTAVADPVALHALCRERGVPLADDLGSGSLVDLAAYGLPPEPTIRAALERADVVTFSGDKLLGAVQCGIVAGRKDLIARVRKNPLKRALRVDKMTYAALEAVLRLYLHPERLRVELPTLRLLTRDRDSIAAQADSIREGLAKLDFEPEVILTSFHGVPRSYLLKGDPYHCQCHKTGRLIREALGLSPEKMRVTFQSALVLTPASAGSRGAGGRCRRLAEELRRLPVPVIGRISDEAVRLDLRTLEDEAGFLDSLAALPPVAGGGRTPRRTP